MRFAVLLAVGVVGVVGVGGAQPPVQAPPATEIYLAALTRAGRTLTVGAPVNITNNPEYDNQPSFLPDGSGVLFTSIRGGKPTDIYRYDLKTKQLTQLTHTDENEYSPLVTPDGKTFSVVRGAEQQLWRFDLDGSHPRLAYAHTGLIGYHVWIDAGHLAVFVLGPPATLQLIDVAANKAEVIATNIGRSLLIRPGRGTVSYVSKAQQGAWTVNEFNPKTRAITTLVKTPVGSEDCAWLPDGTLLMGQKSRLVSWRPGATDWTDVADLSSGGLAGITRLATSRDGHWLAIVAQPTAASF